MPMDANELQEQEIVQETAKLVFTPEFIPYYGEVKKEFGISHVATLIYGFVRFYLHKKGATFYFTNKQLGEILDVSEDRAGKCFMELQTKNLVSVNYRIKGGGGKVRFVDFVYGRTVENNGSEQLKTQSTKPAETHLKSNYINNNKLNVVETRTNKYTTIDSIKGEDMQEIADHYHVPLSMVQFSYEALRNYCESKGKRYKNYKAALRNFVMGDAKKTIEGRMKGNVRPTIDARGLSKRV